MQRLALIASLLLLAAATARAVTSGYEERLKAVRAEAAEQRRKLGLDDFARRTALYAKYPTPEFTFDGEAPRVGCGQSAALKLTGHWPKGTVFLVDTDDAQLSDVKDDGHTWQARLKTAAAALGSIGLHAIAPVSGADRSVRAAEIRARYELELKFADGWTAHFSPSQADAGSGQQSGPLHWRKGEKQREGLAALDPGKGRLTLDIQPAPEVQQATEELATKLQAMQGDEALASVMKRAEECMKKAGEAQAACLQKASDQAEKAGEAMRKKMEKAQAEANAKLPEDAWTCSRLELTARNGALSGTASCAADRTQPVTGTFKCAGAIEEP